MGRDDVSLRAQQRALSTDSRVRTICIGQAAFEAVKDDPSFDESRGLWKRGRPPVEMIQAMCLRPEILRGFAGLGGSV